MKLLGYSNRWSVRPGGAIDFHVSSEVGDFRVDLVRLIHSDANPAGPGFKQEFIDSDVCGIYPGRAQRIRTGSCMLIDDISFPPAGWTMTAWLWPTTPGRGLQGLVTRCDPALLAGWELVIADGRLELRLGEGASAQRLQGRHTLREREWYFICFGYDAQTRQVFLHYQRREFAPQEHERTRLSKLCDRPPEQIASAPLSIASRWSSEDSDRPHPTACYNGKLADVRLFAGSLSDAQIDSLYAGEVPLDLLEQRLADWDFARDMAGAAVADRSGNERHGRLFNLPTRAVTGPGFKGDTERFHEAPEQYNAIHFHDDDLEDAGWPRSFTLNVPTDFKSGVYAVLLRSDEGHQDHVPFFVCPPAGRATARIAVLVPTLSYLAYANESLQMQSMLGALIPLRNAHLDAQAHAYIRQQHLLSTYGTHSDGSGVCYASLLRPCLGSLRPTQRARARNAPHKLGMDLYLIDWLEAKSIRYDVITDHELHREGAGLLNNYRAVISGTHAEYWTGAMLDALESYQKAGGRFICLSGNTMYWVSALDERGVVMEVRRFGGTRSWTCEPGQEFISLSGERGGLWRHRGRAPQRYTGVGMAAQGFDRNAPYKRTQASRDPRAAFIFDGIEEELIGDFPALNLTYGAGGYEIDRADFQLGTPAHALVVASATEFSNCYQRTVEECEVTTPFTGGVDDAQIRADMVFFECPNGGAVFSVGSISWCSALSYNGYQNSVSRVLHNVITAFAAEGPLPGARV